MPSTPRVRLVDEFESFATGTSGAQAIKSIVLLVYVKFYSFSSIRPVYRNAVPETSTAHFFSRGSRQLAPAGHLTWRARRSFVVQLQAPSRADTGL